MKEFMGEDFLLNTETAKALFAAASREPIFDYHCHLSAQEICENKPFRNLAELWLAGDHYKWRVMRACGVPEQYITGDGSWHEKFSAWAGILPLCIGNPLYQWSHLELQRYFGISIPLSAETSEEIWNRANAVLACTGLTPGRILKSSGVAALCTTDDPADSLMYHMILLHDGTLPVKVLPAFRPDRVLHIEAPGFAKYLHELAASSGVSILSFDDLKDALARRLDVFVSLGCVASDHGFSRLPFRAADEAETEVIFRRALRGETPDAEDCEKYVTSLMLFLAGQYAKRGIVMELHIGALRNCNTAMLSRLGADTGFDSVGDWETAMPLCRMLDSMAQQTALPKTVLFAMNPKDNYVFASMAGNFQSEETAGKIQFGPAWWMNDHLDGMRRQMTDLASLGVLGRFIGMTTDSRSFLSYTRHEYFRRLLCGMLGEWVENGEYPCSVSTLQSIVRAISFENAKNYFGLRLSGPGAE